jgi:hypothetical protein
VYQILSDEIIEDDDNLLISCADFDDFTSDSSNPSRRGSVKENSEVNHLRIYKNDEQFSCSLYIPYIV